MTNAEITDRVARGTSVGYRREYVRRVERTPKAQPCQRGHLACALTFDGPCAREVYQRPTLPNPYADRLVALIELKVAIEIAVDAAKIADAVLVEMELRQLAERLQRRVRAS